MDLVHYGDMQVNVHEAKTNFSRLLQRALEGEEITIAKAGVPVARLVPVEPSEGKRKLGLYSGKIWMADDFDGPLPPDILAGFLGEEMPRESKKPRSKNQGKRRKQK